MQSNELAALRQEYLLASLTEADTNEDPILQFQKWFKEAVESGIDDVNAMSLATVGSQNKPHSRIVLLKGLENEKFVFFTNYHSYKGREIDANPNVALNFYWVALQRQIRIEGTVEKISAADSAAYFHSRPIESQLGAWASHQSEPLFARQDLDVRYAELKEKYEGKEIPCPPHWGGYEVMPCLLEFWQGRQSRMHDRICYSKLSNESWIRSRLNP